MPGGDQARTAVPNMVDSLAIKSDIGKEGVIPCQAPLAEDYHSNSIASKQLKVRMSGQTSINLSVNANFDQKCHENAKVCSASDYDLVPSKLPLLGFTFT